MISVADPAGIRAHDAYHRFLRVGRWSMEQSWQILAVQLVALLCPTGVVPLDLDDTLYKKSGRKVDGAGVFRDAVRTDRRSTLDFSELRVRELPDRYFTKDYMRELD